MRNFVFSANVIEGFAKWLSFSRRRLIQAALDATNCIKHFFIGDGILNNQLRLAIDGQDFRAASALEPSQVHLGVPLKIRK